MRPLTFGQLQREHARWAKRNFPDKDPYEPLLGVMEEVGELSHAHLKAVQGIRGTKEEHAEKAKDAIGDIIVFLADYCTENGYDMQEIVETVWAEVRRRDWKKNPVDADKKVG